MKIITANSELFNELLRVNVVDSYIANKFRDHWEYEISIDEEVVLSIHKNKVIMKVKTSDEGYKIADLSSFRDWYVEL